VDKHTWSVLPLNSDGIYPSQVNLFLNAVDIRVVIHVEARCLCSTVGIGTRCDRWTASDNAGSIQLYQTVHPHCQDGADYPRSSASPTSSSEAFGLEAIIPKRVTGSRTRTRGSHPCKTPTRPGGTRAVASVLEQANIQEDQSRTGSETAHHEGDARSGDHLRLVTQDVLHDHGYHDDAGLKADCEERGAEQAVAHDHHDGTTATEATASTSSRWCTVASIESLLALTRSNDPAHDVAPPQVDDAALSPCGRRCGQPVATVPS